MSEPVQHIQNVMQNATDVSYAASAIAAITGTLTWLNDNAGAVGALCAIGGLIVAVATFGLNWYYKRK